MTEATGKGNVSWVVDIALYVMPVSKRLFSADFLAQKPVEHTHKFTHANTSAHKCTHANDIPVASIALHFTRYFHLNYLIGQLNPLHMFIFPDGTK